METAAVVGALQQTLGLQVRDVLVHGCQGTEAETGSNLLVGRGVAISLGEGREEVEDLFLPPCNRHGNHCSE